MNIPVITQLISLIEEIFKAHGATMAKAAEEAAVAGVEQDPKVQAVTVASVALLAAAQDLKTAISATPAESPQPDKPSV
jgi:uncharacterized membrane protein